VIFAAMKRQQDRDGVAKNKRSRMGYGGPDGGDIERLSPEIDRREGRGSRPKNHRDREMREHRSPRDRDYDVVPDRMPKRHKEDRILVDPYVERRIAGAEYAEYRTLCISNLNTQVPDVMIREALVSEFEKIGDFNIKIEHGATIADRMAYLNFRHPEDAKSAKHLRNKEIIFDRPMRIDSVYEQSPGKPNAPPWPAKRRRSSASPPRGPLPRGLPPSPRGLPPIGYIDGDLYPPQRGLSPPPPRMNRPRHMSRDNHPSPREREYQPGQPPFDNRRPQEGGGPPRFPHHLEHIDPEDDVNATRTLFVGKIDNNIEDEELRDVFGHYGIVEEIDIKRPQGKGPGTSYAFVKFFNLDMAHRAKVQMSGEYIGKFQCKIGYGKATATTCLWVGGLGPWIRPESLEREFDRFGVINRIEWPQGKNFAFVLYDSLDAAQAACQEMRGFPLGGPERRIKMDFADVTHLSHPPLGVGSPPPPKPHLDDSP
jgi:RNA-binding protein 15